MGYLEDLKNENGRLYQHNTELQNELDKTTTCLGSEIRDLKDKLRLYETAWQQECKEYRVNVVLNSVEPADPEEIEQIKQVFESARSKHVRPMPVETCFGIDWQAIAEAKDEEIHQKCKTIDRLRAEVSKYNDAWRTLRGVLGKEYRRAAPVAELVRDEITDLRMEVDRLMRDRAFWRSQAERSDDALDQLRSERDDLRDVAEELAESLIALRDEVVEHVTQTLHNSSPDTPSIASVLGLDDDPTDERAAR